MDSQKFFLSLYGHKLPVSCLDISTDGDLLVSGSYDKNLKIWGLDFGDCHKSIFAHAARYYVYCCKHYESILLLREKKTQTSLFNFDFSPKLYFADWQCSGS